MVGRSLERYLRNVKGFQWKHKRIYRIYRELELNLRIKPRKRLVRNKPDLQFYQRPRTRPPVPGTAHQSIASDRTSVRFPFAELNPRRYGDSDRWFCVHFIFGGRVGEPPNRQGAALFNQSVDSLNHGIPGKALSRIRLELTRTGWQ